MRSAKGPSFGSQAQSLGEGSASGLAELTSITGMFDRYFQPMLCPFKDKTVPRLLDFHPVSALVGLYTSPSLRCALILCPYDVPFRCALPPGPFLPRMRREKSFDYLTLGMARALEGRREDGHTSSRWIIDHRGENLTTHLVPRHMVGGQHNTQFSGRTRNRVALSPGVIACHALGGRERDFTMGHHNREGNEARFRLGTSLMASRG